MTNKTAAPNIWNLLEERRNPEPEMLRQLSSLTYEESERLTGLWSGLPVDIRYTITRIASEMAEADFELDFSALFRLGLSDKNADVRATSIEGLCEDNDIRLVSRFAQLLQEDEAISVRTAAAQALGRFVLLGELNKIRQRPFDKACHALLDAYHDKTEALEVKRRALTSLAYTGLHNVPNMIQESYAHSEEKMRISAVFAMGRSAEKRWAKIVRRELNNVNPEMRFEAVRACGELGISEAVRELKEMVEDVDPAIQEMALWSLGQIGGELARRTLKRYVLSQNEGLKASAQQALRELEFIHGDLSTFYGPPEEFSGEGELSWEEDDALLAEEGFDIFDVDESEYEDDDYDEFGEDFV